MNDPKKYPRPLGAIALEGVAVLTCALVSGCGGDAAPQNAGHEDEASVASPEVTTVDPSQGKDGARKPPARIVEDTTEFAEKDNCEDIRMAKPPCNH